ncbi:MAG: hypothetical protein ABSA52_18045 [Candidatus Binatia bacterium]
MEIDTHCRTLGLRIIGFLRLDPAARYLMLDTVENVEATPTPAR